MYAGARTQTDDDRQNYRQIDLDLPEILIDLLDLPEICLYMVR